MRLAPLFKLWVVEWESEDGFAELHHDVGPVDFIYVWLIEAKKAINLRQRTQKVSATVSSALFKAGWDLSKLIIIRFSFFIAALKGFTCDGVGEGMAGAIVIPIQQLPSSMPKQLMAPHVQLVAVFLILFQQLCLPI